ncbi:MAG TPA: hypothetical protein PKM25_01675 [Candidatus Ozemobacteraceae bacterium]|nr:hypothetical protein [Candidatus Ozemobacteraceae bacterium]
MVINKTQRFSLRRSRSAMTLIELLFVMGMILLLSGTMYEILRNVQKTFTHSRNKLDILQTTRIIMSGIRNELRNAIDKPEASLLDNANIMNIPVRSDETIVYHFDKKTRRLYRGKKGNMREGDPDIGDMRPFMFDDGQILKFEFDNSYRNSDSFVESELALNSKVWFKVSMTILFTEKFASLSDTEKQKIMNDPNDPRVKQFFMMITPRRVNWLLQATQ